MNDINFWNQYNKKTKKRISELMERKEKIYVDLHMHSNYSTDGKQSLTEIIENTKQRNFDIISITDHDNIEVYDELYKLIEKDEEITPIIIPGVEFTVECREYGSQCHILQYFINPKEEEMLKDIEKNEKAGWNRAKRQFERIKYNKALQYFCKNKELKLSFEEYKEFLITSKLYIPEYMTITEYIKQKLLRVNVNVLEVFDKLEEVNKEDKCEERRIAKENKYKYLREKYKNNKEASTSTRLLLSIIAVKGVDDDYYKGYENSGSLSVNEYNQIKIENLNNKYLTIFAHPNPEGFKVIDNIEKYSDNIKGIENNYRSFYSKEDLDCFYKIAKKQNFIITVGSDSHDNKNTFYKEMDFYIMDKENIKRMIG